MTPHLYSHLGLKKPYPGYIIKYRIVIQKSNQRIHLLHVADGKIPMPQAGVPWFLFTHFVLLDADKVREIVHRHFAMRMFDVNTCKCLEVDAFVDWNICLEEIICLFPALLTDRRCDCCKPSRCCGSAFSAVELRAYLYTWINKPWIYIMLLATSSVRSQLMPSRMATP